MPLGRDYEKFKKQITSHVWSFCNFFIRNDSLFLVFIAANFIFYTRAFYSLWKAHKDLKFYNIKI